MEKRFKESKEIMDAYLTYAVGEKGHLVHVDDVPNGEACINKTQTFCTLL